MGTFSKLSSSVTFWTAIAALVPLLFGTVQYIQSRYPKRLVLALKGPADPDETKRKGIRNSLGSYMESPAGKVFYSIATHTPNGKIIGIVLAGTGKRDVTSDSFDLGEPLTLDVGATIIAVLSHSRPRWARAPSASVNGQCLRIGPGLIGRRQYLSYRLLISGTDFNDGLQAALTDVHISIANSYDLYSRRLRATFRSYPFFLIALGGYATFVVWLVMRSAPVVYLTGLISVYAASVPAVIFGRAAVRKEGFTTELLVPKGGVLVPEGGDGDIVHSEEAQGRAPEVKKTADRKPITRRLA